MRGGAAIVGLGAGLVLASAALAATAPPVAGGRYKGTDDSKASYASSRAVNLSVSKSRATFASGRFNFVLKGRAGLGSCAGPAFVTLRPTAARQISARGAFDLRGRFTFKASTPYGGVTYTANVALKGAFSNRGRKVAGTLQETASSRHLTCRSGLVHFSAKLVK